MYRHVQECLGMFGNGAGIGMEQEGVVNMENWAAPPKDQAEWFVVSRGSTITSMPVSPIAATSILTTVSISSVFVSAGTCPKRAYPLFLYLQGMSGIDECHGWAERSEAARLG